MIPIPCPNLLVPHTHLQHVLAEASPPRTQFIIITPSASCTALLFWELQFPSGRMRRSGPSKYPDCLPGTAFDQQMFLPRGWSPGGGRCVSLPALRWKGDCTSEI